MSAIRRASRFKCAGCGKKFTHGFFRGQYINAKSQQPVSYRLCDGCGEKLFRGDARQAVIRNIARRLDGGGA